jgi:AraC-like DNA-binding protein
MPIYMDVHILPGVKARDVAEAHYKDVLIQGEHQCKCITYWIDEERENIFCLIEAPSKEAVNTMHGKAHGLIPNKIIEVNNNLVVSFLGRIYDPLDAEITDDGLKVFTDPSFRILMVVSLPDAVLLKYKLGEDKAESDLNRIYSLIRDNLKLHEGREVEEKGHGFISSFKSATKAVACALAVNKQISETTGESIHFKIGISAGEPVANSEVLFGDAVQIARNMCGINKKHPILISSQVEELVSQEFIPERRKKIHTLTPHDESLLNQLYQQMEEHWMNPAFNVAEFCDVMAMSKSQLYRKTMSLCGTSTVLLLKDFRLEKAKELMKKQRYNISEITFASGFASPSYFTKCFKKKYGLLPMVYVDLLH